MSQPVTLLVTVEVVGPIVVTERVVVVEQMDADWVSQGGFREYVGTLFLPIVIGGHGGRGGPMIGGGFGPGGRMISGRGGPGG